jgi:hypothetical protein
MSGRLLDIMTLMTYTPVRFSSSIGPETALEIMFKLDLDVASCSRFN